MQGAREQLCSLEPGRLFFLRAGVCAHATSRAALSLSCAEREGCPVQACSESSVQKPSRPPCGSAAATHARSW